MKKVKKKPDCSEYSIRLFSFDQTHWMNMALKLRLKVFVNEQKVPYDLELDGDDPLSQHIIVYNEEKALATCRCRRTDEGLKLERFAVRKACRGKGLGKILVETALEKCAKINENIYLYAQTDVIAFYRNFGFEPCGDEFIEAGISHVKMIYRLDYGKQR